MTAISSLGEFALIDKLCAQIQLTHTSTLKGVGDDAAIFTSTKSNQLASSNLFLEGIHFNLMYTPLKHLGYKLVVASISNIIAMNAYPLRILVSIGVSARFQLEDLELLYSGINVACAEYHLDFVGGDTNSSVTGMCINITALGEANAEDICRRSGAKENDLICISGDLGAAYMGLQVLERERRIFEQTNELQPQLDQYNYILEKQLRPYARVDMLDLFIEHQIKPTAMIDISDGLASEMLHLCKQSEVGARIYLEKIPISSETFKVCEEMNSDAVTAALNGGDDYELLFTIPLEHHDRIKSISNFEVIGHIVPSSLGANLITPEGQEISLQAQGWTAL